MSSRPGQRKRWAPFTSDGAVRSPGCRGRRTLRSQRRLPRPQRPRPGELRCPCSNLSGNSSNPASRHVPTSAGHSPTGRSLARGRPASSMARRALFYAIGYGGNGTSYSAQAAPEGQNRRAMTIFRVSEPSRKIRTRATAEDRTAPLLGASAGARAPRHMWRGRSPRCVRCSNVSARSRSGVLMSCGVSKSRAAPRAAWTPLGNPLRSL